MPWANFIIRTRMQHGCAAQLLLKATCITHKLLSLQNTIRVLLLDTSARHSGPVHRLTAAMFVALQNLALNVAEKGFSISVFNRTYQKTEAAVTRAKKSGVLPLDTLSISTSVRGTHCFQTAPRVLPQAWGTSCMGTRTWGSLCSPWKSPGEKACVGPRSSGCSCGAGHSAAMARPCELALPMVTGG
jgi:hypothetical protein